jgi:hypothetical protein
VLTATGPERHGWRVNVETEQGIVAFGVLVAPAGDLWRARILTYPNILWIVPGGRAALKFVGDSAQEAEQEAIRYIRDHCRDRRFRIRDAGIVRIEGSAAKEAGDDSSGSPAERVVRFLPIRFGVVSPSETGGTGNLSETGLFIITSTPLDAGSRLEMLLMEADRRYPLTGEVVWRRDSHHAGRSPGMGIQLDGPSGDYLGYVRGLSRESER